MKKFTRSVYSRNKPRNEATQPCLRDGGSGGVGGGHRIRPRSNSFSSPSTCNMNPNIRSDGGSQTIITKQTSLQSIKRKFTSKFSKIRQRNHQETAINGEGRKPGSSRKNHIGNENCLINDTTTKPGGDEFDRQTHLGYRLSKSEEALDYCEVPDKVKVPENCYVFKDENCSSTSTTDNMGEAPPVPPRAPKMEDVLNNDHNDAEEPPRPPARPKNRSMGRLPGHLERSFASVSVDGGGGNRATVYETPVDRGSMRNSRFTLGIGAELMKLPKQSWYWGPLRQQEAEEKLKNLPDGMFLVRDSSDDRYLLSLSFNSNGRTLHTRIEYRNGLFSLNDSEGYPSIITLIEKAVHESKHGVFGYMRDFNGVQSFPAKLTDWVSRFKEVRSLQYLCRFVIRERYARHVIPQLPIPTTIKDYVLKNQY